MTSNRKTLGYNSPDHRLFNERLEDHNNPKPTYDVVKRPWMSDKAVASLPNPRHDFLKNTDPMRLKELRANVRHETQRRGETGGRSSKMVSEEQPKADLKPPPEISQPCDQEKFNRNWLREQRDAAMANNARIPQSQQDQPQIEYKYRIPER